MITMFPFLQITVNFGTQWSLGFYEIQLQWITHISLRQLLQTDGLPFHRPLQDGLSLYQWIGSLARETSQLSGRCGDTAHCDPRELQGASLRIGIYRVARWWTLVSTFFSSWPLFLPGNLCALQSGLWSRQEDFWYMSQAIRCCKCG